MNIYQIENNQRQEHEIRERNDFMIIIKITKILITKIIIYIYYISLTNIIKYIIKNIINGELCMPQKYIYIYLIILVNIRSIHLHYL